MVRSRGGVCMHAGRGGGGLVWESTQLEVEKCAGSQAVRWLQDESACSSSQLCPDPAVEAGWGSALKITHCRARAGRGSTRSLP